MIRIWKKSWMYFLIFSILFGAFGCIEEKNMEGQIDSVKNYEVATGEAASRVYLAGG